jgi:hypothetical protein
MGKRVSIRHKRKEAPEWLFPWRPLGDSFFPKWFALLVVGGAFAFLLTSVRIRVTPLVPWAARKASLIHVTDNAESRALTLRAREGGPFPSRFEPSAWDGAAALELAAFEAIRAAPAPHVPVLRDLPEDATEPTRLAASGQPVLPKRRMETLAPAVSGNLKLAPVLYPRSGITAAAMPATLPAFEGEVGEKMTAEPWHFLVRLDAAGNVMDCVSLAGEAEGDAAPLEAWLRRVSFNPEPKKPSRWIAVGVGFTNQAADGRDAR